jgi:cell division transport system permease protein
MSTASRAWRGGKADWKLHALSAFSLAVAFVCLASALLVVVNLDEVRHRWARAGRASVYLRDGATEEMVADLRRALEQTPGVTAVRYVSSAEARHEVVSDDSDGALAALPPEAFPSSLEVDMASSVTEVDLQSMTANMRKLPVVESVETYQRYTDKLQGLLQAALVGGLVLACVVLAAVVSVVASTVRLALQRRRIEVDVLRLVGATEQYVRRPFVVEGCVIGAIGAAAAVAILGLIYAIIHPHVAEIATLVLGVSPTFLPWYAVGGLIALGAALGAASSHFSLKSMATV